jgi:hypothetical protein
MNKETSRKLNFEYSAFVSYDSLKYLNMIDD